MHLAERMKLKSWPCHSVSVEVLVLLQRKSLIYLVKGFDDSFLKKALVWAWPKT